MHPLVKEIQKSQLKKVPEIKTGYTVRVHQKIKEGNKERVQVFEGLVIKTGHGEGTEKTITVRKVVQGIGVEKVFMVHSPTITKIEVKKKAKVRRSKLYYMRQRSGKSARLQERHVTDKERAEEEAKMEAMIQEAVKAEEKRKAEEVKSEGETQSDTAEPSGDAVGAAHVQPDEGNEGAAHVPSDEEEPKEETPPTEGEDSNPREEQEPEETKEEATEETTEEQEEESKDKPSE